MNRKKHINYVQFGLKICLVITLTVFIVLSIQTIVHRNVQSQHIAIVLAAHPGDAELALGGLINQVKKDYVIADFFTTSSSDTLVDPESRIKKFNYASVSSASSEAAIETQSEISQDIQALISANGDKEVSIYAPSTFGTSTNSDVQVLYQAYLDVASAFPNPNVQFYFYENYPQTEDFNRTSVISIRKNVENDSDLVLDTVSIPLSNGDLNKKEKLAQSVQELQTLNSIKADDLISNARAYSQKRCGSDGACEVVYKIHRY